MSDDTQHASFESVLRRQISADDPSLDALTTITIRIEREGSWTEVTFKSKPEDVEFITESMSPAEVYDLEPSMPVHPEAMIRAWPGKRTNKFHLKAEAVRDPETGTIYVQRYAPNRM